MGINSKFISFFQFKRESIDMKVQGKNKKMVYRLESESCHNFQSKEQMLKLNLNSKQQKRHQVKIPNKVLG